MTQSEVIRADPGMSAGALGKEVYSFALFLSLVARKPGPAGAHHVQAACLQREAIYKKTEPKTVGKVPDAIISGVGPGCVLITSSSYNF